MEPLRYAAAWNEDLASDTGRFTTTLDDWLDYYRRRGIDAIGIGAVVLRRRTSERNWVKTAELARGPSGAAGDQVRRVFAAQDVREATTGRFSPLDHRFAAVGHRLQQVLTFRDGAYTAEDAAILLDDGLGLRNRVPPQALHVLLRMDGSRTLGELVVETAEETGLDVESLTSSAVSCVGELFQLGFLEHYP
jgi:hypothetical protein